MPAYLNILISTIDRGIENLHNVILDYRDDVTYIVSHQYTKEEYKYVPKVLLRKDILISQIKGRGVTKSRNNAIRLADGEIGLFADDDVTYTHKYFDTVINKFLKNELLDVGLFKIKSKDTKIEYKNYPKESIKLNKLPFSVGTIEISFRVNSIKDHGIFFDERFGAGQNLLIGADESIFVLDCIKKRLYVWFFPEYIVDHPFISTVKKLPKYDRRKVSVTGAFDARINGVVAIPKAFLGTLRYLPDLIRQQKNPFIYLRERLFSAIYIIRTNKK